MKEINLGKLRGLRAEYGMTQEEVAKAIDISTNSYNRKEKGKRRFTLIEAKKIADLFGVSIEDIFFRHKLSKTVKNEQQSA